MAKSMLNAIPLVGPLARYFKRLLALPVRFHRHAAATAENRAIVNGHLYQLQQQSQNIHQQLQHLGPTMGSAVVGAIPELSFKLLPQINESMHRVVNHQIHVTLPGLMTEFITPMVQEQLQRDVQAPVMAMLHEFRTRVAELNAELKSLNDRHALCYDRIVEQLRQQTQRLQAIAASLPEGPAAEAIGQIAREQVDLSEANPRLRLRA
ncbi:MAG: hypothetical protein ACRCZF_21420 [Gemmataceae bacterium]